MKDSMKMPKTGIDFLDAVIDTFNRGDIVTKAPDFKEVDLEIDEILDIKMPDFMASMYITAINLTKQLENDNDNCKKIFLSQSIIEMVHTATLELLHESRLDVRSNLRLTVRAGNIFIKTKMIALIVRYLGIHYGYKKNGTVSKFIKALREIHNDTQLCVMIELDHFLISPIKSSVDKWMELDEASNTYEVLIAMNKMNFAGTPCMDAIIFHMIQYFDDEEKELQSFDSTGPGFH